jgi:hypothetical protein
MLRMLSRGIIFISRGSKAYKHTEVLAYTYPLLGILTFRHINVYVYARTTSIGVE